jgi:hypothetical protein
MADTPLFLEKSLSSSGKHGILWTEGPARAIKTGQAQGQFGSQDDLDFVLEKAKDVGIGGQEVLDLPERTTCVLHLVDGSIISATRVYIRVYSSGKVHAFPCEDGYSIR